MLLYKIIQSIMKRLHPRFDNFAKKLNRPNKGEVMAKYFFSIGLIPVQDFIEESTRCRDVRAGSALLSWLTASSLHYLQKSHNATIIIPYFEDNKIKTIAEANFKEIIEAVGYSIPNRASGYLDAVNVGELSKIFQALNDKLLERWQSIYKVVMDSDIMGNIIKASCISSHFAQPSSCPIQLIGAAKKGISDDYLENLVIIDNEYANIKLTRPVAHWTGAPIPKCQQCGKREAIGPEEFHNWNQWFKNKLCNEQWVKKERYIDKKEALCLTCLQKRFSSYLAKPAFGSTSEIASRIWRDKARKVDKFQAYLTEIEKLKKMDFPDPESLLFKSSINRFISEEEDDQIQQQLNKILKFRREYEALIKSKTEIIIKSEPSSYLAVLTFDGDNMGRHVKSNLKIHKNLMLFANDLIGLYGKKENKMGIEVFYIGGDEGLMLAPIESALRVALDIQKLFENTFNSDGKDSKITLSMGIAIFDRERPLGAAIRLARQALVKAKDQKGKNSLTIAVQTASGNVFSSSAHWGSDWQRVSNAIDYLSGQAQDQYLLSMGWAYEVEKYLERLPGDQWGREIFRNAVRDEVKRITKRKIQKKENLDSDETTVENSSDNQAQQKQAIDTIWGALDGNQWFKSDLKGQAISAQLHLIAFLSRESGFRVAEETNKETGERL